MAVKINEIVTTTSINTDDKVVVTQNGTETRRANAKDLVDKFTEGIKANVADLTKTVQDNKTEILNTIGTEEMGTTATTIKGAIAEHTSQLNDIAINVKNFGAVGDGVTDDTKSIQDTINFCYSKKGGTVLIPKGNFKISKIIVRSKVDIVGDGLGKTVLQCTEEDDSCIFIPKNSQFFSISDMSLVGKLSKNECQGILFEKSNGNSISYNHEGMFDSNYIAENEITYKYCFINNLSISNFSGMGILQNKVSYATYMHDLFIRNCEIGMYILATDNMYNTIYAERNRKHGIYVEGSSNKFSNIKSIWNGSLDNIEISKDTPISVNSAPFFGFVLKERFSCINNLECQENFGNGLAICSNNNIISCLLDTNGIDYLQYNNNNNYIGDNKSTQLYLDKSSENNIINCQIVQWKTDIDKISKYGILDYSNGKNNLNYKINNNCCYIKYENKIKNIIQIYNERMIILEDNSFINNDEVYINVKLKSNINNSESFEYAIASIPDGYDSVLNVINLTNRNIKLYGMINHKNKALMINSEYSSNMYFGDTILISGKYNLYS